MTILSNGIGNLADGTSNRGDPRRIRKDSCALGGSGRQSGSQQNPHYRRGHRAKTEITMHRSYLTRSVGVGIRGRVSARSRQSPRSHSPSGRSPKNWMIILPSAP